MKSQVSTGPVKRVGQGMATPVTLINRRKLLATSAAFAAIASARPSAAASQMLDRTIDASLILLDGASGALIDARLPDQRRIPASLAKIPSLCAARIILGADHRFTTRFDLAGQSGDQALMLSGGDPTLTIEGLTELLTAITPPKLAMPPISRFAVDPGPEVPLTEITPSQSPAAPYNPGLAGMALNFNRARVKSGGKGAGGDRVFEWLGAPGVVVPTLHAVPVDDSHLPFTVTRHDGQETWALPAGQADQIELPIGDPTRALGLTIVNLAAAQGLVLPMPTQIIPGSEFVTLAQRQSAALDEIIQGCLRYSTNVTAEMVTRAAALARTGGKPLGSLARSAAQAIDQLVDRHASIDWSGAILENGSGLGTAARLTVRQIASVLWAEPDFANLLKPINPAKPGSLKVKTGTLAYVRGLAGTFTTQAGERRIFAILASDDSARAALDRVRPPLLNVPPESRLWLAQAKRQEVSLLEQWGLPADEVRLLTV
jgi:D-alanyl-D-alanine carboxypeptidase/D-alanyl-D-alanine-endopeptidase (penicillin-binding protein 4)